MRVRPSITAVVLAAAVLTGCRADAPTAAGDVPTPAAVPSPAPDAGADGTGLDPALVAAAAAVGTHHHGHTAATPVDLPDGIQPVRIRIPAIGVDADVTELGMLSATEMETPSDFDQAGWWRLSRLPGEIGPAVVAGHVDSRTGPAVFFRLGELRAGDEIVVSDAGGATRTFVVRGSDQFPKDALPDEVFGFDRPVPQLRLITCGGDFDRASGHYTDNIVVFADAEEA